VNDRVRAPLLAALFCAAGFVVLLGFAYAVPLTAHLDATALTGLAALRGPTVTPIAVAAAHLADPLPVVVIVTALVGVGFACGRRREAIAAAVMVVAAIVTAETLKVLLAHPRTAGVAGYEQVGTAAFPSGHATASIAVALAAVLAVPRRIRPAVALAGAVYATAVCISILVLVWHFPSDVFSGMLVASFYFCVALAALRSDRRWVPEKPGRLRASLRPPSWWREGVLGVLLAGGVVVLARASDLAAFASEHTAATAVAAAVALCSATLIAAAGLIADR
jgi:membrane-associated phospholipid phosphatase